MLSKRFLFVKVVVSNDYCIAFVMQLVSDNDQSFEYFSNPFFFGKAGKIEAFVECLHGIS